MPSARGVASSRARQLSTALLPIALLILGMTIAFYPMLFSKLGQMQSDPGDTRFVNFILEYEYRWLRGDPVAREFWNPGIFFPERNTLAYSDIFLSMLPFYAPWRSLGAAPDTAYQFFLLTMGGLNFIAAYLLLRNGFGRTVAGSSFGAFLFSFGSIRLNQLNHPQLVAQLYILVSLYGLVRIFGDAEGSDRHFGWWLALFYAGITAQFYADYYHGWFYLFALGLCCIWGLINSDARPRLRGFLRSKWKWLAAGFLLWAVSLTPLAIHYWQAAKRVGFRDFGPNTGSAVPHLLGPSLSTRELKVCDGGLSERPPGHWPRRLQRRQGGGREQFFSRAI